MELTTLKSIIALYYSFISAIILSAETNNYDKSFQDPYLYISGFLGMSLMLLVEKVDDKSISKPSLKKITFSIIACLSVMFFSGIARTDFLGQLKPFWIYLGTMFFCTIAPEFVQRVIIKSPKHLERGFNKGIERRIEKIIGGDDDRDPGKYFEQHSEFEELNQENDD